MASVRPPTRANATLTSTDWSVLDLTPSMIEEGYERLRRQDRRDDDPRVTLVLMPHAEVSYNAGAAKSKTRLRSLVVFQLSGKVIRALAPFEMVTSFLSLQYAFHSRSALLQCLQAVSISLRDGRYFACIIPNGDLIAYVRMQNRLALKKCHAEEGLLSHTLVRFQGKFQADGPIW